MFCYSRQVNQHDKHTQISNAFNSHTVTNLLYNSMFANNGYTFSKTVVCCEQLKFT